MNKSSLAKACIGFEGKHKGLWFFRRKRVMIWIFDLRLNIATDIALSPFKPTSMF